MKGYHILLGEDEPDILEYNREQLEQRGYQVTAVSTLGQAEACVLRDNPDLLVLDVMMPDGSGLELCRRLREKIKGPILFLTSLGESRQIVQGLRAGGDDYIMKPFSLAELTARVEAHLRRESRIQQKISVRVFDDIMVDYAARAILRKDKIIELSKVEFDIVELLSLHPGQVFSREVIYERVRGFEGNADNAVVKEHIRRIRNKIGTQYIETVWGCGYKWLK